MKGFQQESINTRKGVERCLRFAFEYTRKRNKRRNLVNFLCGKTNVLTRLTLGKNVGEVAKEYPDADWPITRMWMPCMRMVKNPGVF